MKCDDCKHYEEVYEGEHYGLDLPSHGEGEIVKMCKEINETIGLLEWYDHDFDNCLGYEKQEGC